MELLIVVVILGITATIVIPRFANQSEKAQTAEAINMMGSIRRAALSYHDEWDEFPVISGQEVNADHMRNLLGLEFDEANWVIHTDAAGGITGTGPGGSIMLDADTGLWSGTGDYDTMGTKCSVLSPRAQVCGTEPR